VTDSESPPASTFPFTVSSVDGNQCYQLAVSKNSTCFADFWDLHAPQYANFALGACPSQYNFIQQQGKRAMLPVPVLQVPLQTIRLDLERVWSLTDKVCPDGSVITTELGIGGTGTGTGKASLLLVDEPANTPFEYNLFEFQSSNGTCVGNIVDNHWGVNNTCYNTGGTNLKCLAFAVTITPVNVPPYTLYCGTLNGCTPDSGASGFPATPNQCIMGNTFGPYPSDWMVTPH
jgi:hypothetical protein